MNGLHWEEFNTDFFKNLKLLLNFRLLIPKYQIVSLCELRELLKHEKVRNIILDIDQTIAPYGSTLIPPKITDVLNFLRDNYSCCFLSNFAKTKTKLERITAIEELTKIKVVMSERRKPDKAAFELALRYLDAIPSETLMIGDRLFTDILGANHTGLVSVYVREPLDPTKDPLFMVRVPRLIENALYSLVNFAMQKKH